MALRHAVPAALLDDEYSGYQPAKAFDIGVANFWHALPQQLYAELAKLEKKRRLLDSSTGPAAGPGRAAGRDSRTALGRRVPGPVGRTPSARPVIGRRPYRETTAAPASERRLRGPPGGTGTEDAV